MDKLTMAHEYAMKMIEANGITTTQEKVSLVQYAWNYANAMHDAAEKQIQEDGKKIREEIREMLKSPNTFIEREGQHFDDLAYTPNLYSDNDVREAHKRIKDKIDFGEPVEAPKEYKRCKQVEVSEWQPDWSQAPEWATHFFCELDDDLELNGFFCEEKTGLKTDWLVRGFDGYGRVKSTETFGYSGNWQDSLRKRPEGKQMKRNKKYNPNKVSNLIQMRAATKQKLWMHYDNLLVDSITDEWLKNHPNEDVPTHLLYPHMQGDLIIAIKHRLIPMERKWYIKMSFDLTDGTQAEIEFDLPKAHLGDIKRDTATFKIDRGNGIKTRWKGLDAEINDILSGLEAEGVEVTGTWAYISCETAFNSKADYSYFVQEKALRFNLGELVAQTAPKYKKPLNWGFSLSYKNAPFISDWGFSLPTCF